MDYFLKDCLNQIVASTNDISKETLIIPNKRASVYIRKHLAETYKKPIWSPDILTIDEWIKKQTDKKIVKGNELVFLFYEIYRNQEKENAESFNKYMSWAKILLKDFDEVDRYLLQPEAVFRDLRNIKELEDWDMDRTEIRKIGRYEEKFLGFWDKILDFYKALNEELKSKNLIYPGRAYKEFALFVNTDEYHDLHFIGFNALSAAEQMLIQKLVRAKKAKIYFDIDQFFVENEAHEAGRFFRELQKNWSEIPLKTQVQNHLEKGQRNFEIVASADQVAQVNLASQKLMDFKNELDQTAIVLADENLIDPLLRSLPDAIEKANITMGLPIRRTSIKNFTDLLFSIQEHLLKFGGKTIYHKDLNQLLNMPIYLKVLSEDERNQAKELQKKILKNNRKFLDLNEVLAEMPAILKENSSIFQKWEFQEYEFLKAYINIASHFLEEKSLSDLEQETLVLLLEILKKLQAFLLEYQNVEISYSIFKKLLNEEIAGSQIDFLGNPTEGLQIMGILETRLLDFKNLIFVGFNEGTLPSGNYSDSILPKDLKLYHKMPVQADKDAIFAHHFYRLTLRAENIYSIYYTKPDMTSTGEKSRYLKQIQLEYPKLNSNNIILEKTYKPLDSKVLKKELIIEKNEAYEKSLDEVFQKGLSPTAMNTFIRCELDFYYRYILKFKEEEKVEEDIEHSTFGSITHKVLEELYKPIVGEVLTPEFLKECERRIEHETSKEFEHNFGAKGFQYGTNQLAFRVVKEYVQRFLKYEKNYLATQVQDELRIIELEKKMETEFQWEINGKPKLIRFQGLADRIDQVDGVTRIMDYKTGSCDPNKLDFKNDLSKLFYGNNKSFALQVLLYSLMYDGLSSSRSGILSLKNLNNGFMTTNADVVLAPDFRTRFEEELKIKVGEMYNRTAKIQHNPSSIYCNYCKG